MPPKKRLASKTKFDAYAIIETLKGKSINAKADWLYFILDRSRHGCRAFYRKYLFEHIADTFSFIAWI